VSAIIGTAPFESTMSVSNTMASPPVVLGTSPGAAVAENGCKPCSALARAVAQPVLLPPKTLSSHRTIPLADPTLNALAAHLRRHPRELDQPVLLTPAGGLVDADRFGHQWRRACRAVGVEVRYHDLRHTYAGTLLSDGVSVKAVAQWLGHASAVTTLKVYSHLMPADADIARAVLNRALARSGEDSLRTTGASANE
jgi:hypothetical protein